MAKRSDCLPASWETPKSAAGYVRRLLQHPTFSGQGPTKAEIATVMGRYWAMDRDKRWERVEKAYLAMTGQIAPSPVDAVTVIEKSYQAGKTDEFIEPV